MSGNQEAVLHFVERIETRNAFYLRPVNAAMALLGVQQTHVEFRFVAEQK